MSRVDTKKFELLLFLCLYFITVAAMLMSNVHNYGSIMVMVNNGGGIKDDSLNNKHFEQVSTYQEAL